MTETESVYRKSRKRFEPALFDVFERRLRLEGQLITRTGLHIGAGGTGNPIGTDLPVVRDGLDRPMIPGASLKGVVRSAAEALLRHLPRPRSENEPQPLVWSCDVVGKDPCVDHGQLRSWRERLRENAMPSDQRSVAEKAWAQSCTVCRLFGSMAIAGRVRFPDLLLAPGQIPLMEVRNGVGIDRDKGQAAEGVLYDFEAVPPETRFQLSVVVDNFDDFEVGLLLYLFDELHRGSLVIGGKTSRGLGQVAIEWRHFEHIEVNPAAGAEKNPFATLLRRQSFEAEQEAQLDLPIPDAGDSELWLRLALALDERESVDKDDVRDACKPLGIQKADVSEKLAASGGRGAFKSVLQMLVDCGRMVRQDGRVVPKAKLEEQRAAALDGARTPAWLLPHYEKYIGAMDALWREAE